MRKLNPDVLCDRHADSRLILVIKEWLELTTKHPESRNRWLTITDIRRCFEIETKLYCYKGTLAGTLIKLGYVHKVRDDGHTLFSIARVAPFNWKLNLLDQNNKSNRSKQPSDYVEAYNPPIYNDLTNSGTKTWQDFCDSGKQGCIDFKCIHTYEVGNSGLFIDKKLSNSQK
ncbi:hypothetical protein [Nostoc sphaeroides]|uniref:Uncharacterized protein n=1 Tax=Nostoc sphaeroides CCNUC1 TaxID=2653204 RepID=A0A5P8VTW7_9NOSO|nr:hypothetical protein [Nostoc sphaeroides]QFS43349.1 hypothetical protein GXM_00822 [Nostoc sphaeroides CCNUC1]